jgi:hypothetical protein
MEEQILELGSATPIQTNDLATDYSRAFDVETAAIAFPRSANDVNAWSLRDTSCVWPAWIAASAPNPSYFSSNSQSGWSNASRRRWNGMGWNGSIVGRIPGRKCLFNAALIAQQPYVSDTKLPVERSTKSNFLGN